MKLKITPASFTRFIIPSIFLLLSFTARPQCPPLGDQVSYGDNEWIGYVYANIGTDNAPENPFITNYGGYVTQPASFDQNFENHPLDAPNLCGDYIYDINFAIKYKMKKTFVPGYYTITVGGDDGYRLSIDGGATYIVNAWTDHAYLSTTETVYLGSETDFVFDYFEHGGLSRVSFNVVPAACSSTAPEEITGNTIYACNNATGTTLTAAGGTHGTGAQYQWGTGQVIGNNVIVNETEASLTVSPSAATYYWVRRANNFPCGGYTDGIVTLVTLNNSGAPGNPVLFGDNVWNVYAYTGTNTTLTQNIYKGYYVQSTLGFHTDEVWDRELSPSVSPAWMGCALPANNNDFTIVHKRQGFPCGEYTLYMDNWDDDTAVYVDNVLAWSRTGWNGGVPDNEKVVGTYSLNANSTIEVMTREFGGAANAQLIITEIQPSVAPTAITGINTICAGTKAVLTAQAGVLGLDAEYQWGTGEPGSNIIANETGSTIEVTVTNSDTYWVRIKKTACDTNVTAVATHYIFVPAPVVFKGIWSGQPDINTAVVIENSLELSEDISACSCRVTNGAVLTIGSGINFTVKGKVTIDEGANMIMNNKASLLQIENVTNEGKASVIRESSKIKRLDYTLWSAPVEGQNLKAFSPGTINKRFYIYNTATDQYNSILDNNAINPETDDFALAKGYLIRTPDNHPVEPTVYTGVFTGVLHNGDVIKLMDYKSDDMSYNAIGNPYASPIRVDAFLSANPEIEGTIWFWRKTNNSLMPSYSTITTLGYNANTATGDNEYAIDPDGVLNIGQGFIVNSRDVSEVVFTNAMRTGDSSSQFFRNNNNNPGNVSRLWLNVTGTEDAFSQTLIGYTPLATTGYDNGIDGRSKDNGSVALYSIIDNMNLAIQGRPDFTTADEVKLGFKTVAAGTFNFTLDHVDGLFTQGQDIFIKDNITGTMHNLNSGNYTFQTEAGTYNDRFTVVYTNAPAMGINDNVAAGKEVVVYRSGKEIGIKSAEVIQAVTVYDIAGRIVYSSNNIKANVYTTTGLNTSQQVLVVKTELINGQVISKKIIID